MEGNAFSEQYCGQRGVRNQGKQGKQVAVGYLHKIRMANEMTILTV